MAAPAMRHRARPSRSRGGSPSTSMTWDGRSIAAALGADVLGEIGAAYRHFGHTSSDVKQARYRTRGSWLCAWTYRPSRDVAIDEAPRAGGDERAGVGDGTSGRGPQRGVGSLAGPPGDDAEGTAG